VNYCWYSTLDGVMQKEDSSSFDYKVPRRLHQLWEAKDYGTYADKKDGKLHTSFIADQSHYRRKFRKPCAGCQWKFNRNEFRPLLEGTMSDVNYDPSICRNISLDVRYTLVSSSISTPGAGYLLKKWNLQNKFRLISTPF